MPQPDQDRHLYHALVDAQLRARLPPFWTSLAAQSSTCVPASTVIVTIVNRAHAPLLQIQRKPLPPCFLRRYGALCFDDTNANATCVRWPARSLGVGLAYTALTWLKWEVLHLALAAPGVRAALWIDCDVAILRSPFGGWLGAVASTVDLTHQRNSIAGDINTGVMLVRSEQLARRVLEVRSVTPQHLWPTYSTPFHGCMSLCVAGVTMVGNAPPRPRAGDSGPPHHRPLCFHVRALVSVCTSVARAASPKCGRQVVVQRLLNGTGFAIAGAPHTSLASYCWLRVREGAPLTPYAQSLLCRPSMLHANCLSAVADKAAAMSGAAAASRERCGNGWVGNTRTIYSFI